MIFIILFIFSMLFSMCVSFRVIISHPISTIRYLGIDLWKYIKGHCWNVCTVGGNIICFCGLFGKGKTLSAVRYVVNQYQRYNDKRIFDFKRKKWVTQKVRIISNVDLVGVPYERFISLSQLVHVADTVKKIDEENDTSTVTIALGDEFSVQLNSRNFKSNIDPLFLNTLLTCRHHGGGMSLIYTSQRFAHCDKLLRDVTSFVVDCNKIWRIMVHGQYDAFELENATSTDFIRPVRRYGWFISDADFFRYDTLACVGNLSRSCKRGDMLSEEQILALRCNQDVNMDGVLNPSRKYVRTSKRLRK